jgi:hypothetical protein
MGLLDMLGMGGGMTEGLFNSLASHGDQLSGLGAGLMSGSNWAEGLGNAFQMGASGMKSDRQRQEEEKRKRAAAMYGQSLKLSPEEAALMEANPEMAQQWALKKQFGAMDQGENERLYAMAKAQGFQGTILDFLNAKGGNKQSTGLQPIWGTREGPDGKPIPVLMQPSTNGEMVESKLPPGVTASRGVKKVDLGDSWAFYDESTGNLIRTEPKNLANAEAQKEIGKDIGKATVSLPAARAKFDSLDTYMDGLIDDPRKGGAVGGWATNPGGTLWGKVSGTDSYAYRSKVQVATNKLFQNAVQEMRGLGSLSNAEGEKVAAAVAALDPDLDEASFNAQLQEVKAALKRWRMVAEQEARGAGVGMAAEPQPGAGGADPYGLR